MGLVVRMSLGSNRLNHDLWRSSSKRFVKHVTNVQGSNVFNVQMCKHFCSFHFVEPVQRVHRVPNSNPGTARERACCPWTTTHLVWAVFGGLVICLFEVWSPSNRARIEVNKIWFVPCLWMTTKAASSRPSWVANGKPSNALRWGFHEKNPEFSQCKQIANVSSKNKEIVIILNYKSKIVKKTLKETSSFPKSIQNSCCQSFLWCHGVCESVGRPEKTREDQRTFLLRKLDSILWGFGAKYFIGGGVGTTRDGGKKILFRVTRCNKCIISALIYPKGIVFLCKCWDLFRFVSSGKIFSLS